MLFFLSSRRDRNLFIKDIALKMLTPNWVLCVILLIAGYQLVSVIRHFWLTPATSASDLSHVSVSETAVTDEHTEENFVFTLFGTASPPLSEGKVQKTTSSLSDDLLSGGDLDVRGILYSSVTEHSVAIFAHNNRQFSLGIGEKVPGYDATISAIFSDHIVINYQGKNASLPLRYDNPAKRNAQDDNNLIVGPVTTQANFRVKTIFDIMSLSPVTVNNTLSGYRLSPGKASSLFYNAGLHDNDLAVLLNGSELRDTRQAQQIMKQLTELKEIKITVERDGQLYDAFIAVGEN
ncbi:type II secretion system protein GspC [Escherichia coli]|uniref:type II secretion system protein GspC n=1 Tax=Escherichia coli TaxID=562 RepID=UPI000F6441AC|nr:type II secretion system protein GspC [Escherichia coli]EFA6841874.1 type II secretion system protein GspC [Escherichia coli]EFD4880544.1 type II secretion system protein GspC [Escherichia coli]EFE8272953.1 type II secretion system protein GspC [Escherichia coli]EFH3341714.1 type II secretion system protein GspC [Escherichia coli]EFH6709237.1 type II secretion system protein GspC [Escherichia coli]